MGMLSMNPDNDGGTARPKLALQIAENEEWGGTPGDLAEKEEPQEVKPVKKMNLGPFQLDMSYPRTFPGLIRLAQIVSL